MIFESGHELGRYLALLRKLRTVACGSLRMGIAETLTVTCRASADGPAHPRPARVRPTGRHGVVCRRSAGAVRPRLRPGYVLDRLLSWSSLYITLFKCLYFLLSPNSISSVDTVIRVSTPFSSIPPAPRYGAKKLYGASGRGGRLHTRHATRQSGRHGRGVGADACSLLSLV